MYKIIKVKFDIDNTTINYHKRTSDDQWDKFNLKSPELPVEVFKERLQDLDEAVCVICDLDIKLIEEFTVTGVVFSYKDLDNFKAGITAKRQTELTNAPMVINTPLIALGELQEEDEHFNFKYDLKNKLKEIMKLAEAYIEGDRVAAQDELPFESEVKEGV